MQGSDYAQIVGNFVGDALGAVPVVGAFATALKNVGANIGATQQRERTEQMISDLAAEVSDAKSKFESRVPDEGFVLAFYKTLFMQKDTSDGALRKLYYGYLRAMLNRELPIEEEGFLFSIVEVVTPFSIRYLCDFRAKHSDDWVDLKAKYGLTKQKPGIDYNDIGFMEHRTLLEFAKLGIFEERHGIFYDENSSGYLERVKISTLGLKLLHLLEQ